MLEPLHIQGNLLLFLITHLPFTKKYEREKTRDKITMQR